MTAKDSAPDLSGLSPELAARIAALPPEKRALFEKRLREQQSASVAPIARVSRDGAMPLSAIEMALWFLEQYEPGRPTYNVAHAVRLRGEVDLDALARALAELVRRHEALRTRYVAEGGRPTRVIDAPWAVAIERSSMNVARDERESAALRWANAEARRPFDLASGRLFRAAILELDAGDRVLVLATHHIACDGWSLEILLRELGALYAGERLEAPRLDYADYAAWQASYASSQSFEQDLRHWRERLDGAPQLELPTDFARPPRLTSRGATRSFHVPRAVAEPLRALAKSEGCTMFMATLAVFAAVVARWSGQRDLVIGTSHAGRDRAELEPIVGMFVNTLALRIDVGGAPTARELVRRARATALDAFAHHRVPFGRLVDELSPTRDPARDPIVQVLFELNATSPPPPIPGAEPPLPVHHDTAKFDLTFTLNEIGDGLAGVVEYRTDLFSERTIATVTDWFTRLAEGFGRSPDARVLSLPMLSPEEREVLTDGAVANARAYPREPSFPEQLAKQAARTPDALAIVFEGEGVTYAELDARADRFAAAMRAEGVRDETIVAVLGERSPDFVASIVGIWRAGGTYMPLDPRQPAARLARILDESGAALVLHDEGRAELARRIQAESTTRARLVAMRSAAAHPRAPLPPGPSPRQLAYVIFTSGSTGAPKGAMVEHGGMINHLWAKVEGFELAASDILAAMASQSFDVSIWQFFAVMLAGGCIWIAPDEVVLDPAALARQLAERRVTVVETVPSQLRALLDVLEPGSLPCLRWMISNGEALQPALAQLWFARFPKVPLGNAYGPTECSDDVTHELMRSAADVDEREIMVGRPIGNTQIFVLDESLGLVPVGSPGEVYVAGAGVGRGYLGRPELTATSFVPHPFAITPGARLYKTGDRGKRRPDGRFVVLGRLDQQVKVRGHRIELGEVESAIAEHPRVRSVVVVVRTIAGQPQLAAYVALDRERPPELDELRDHVKRRLPEAMVPAAFVALDELPLTPNGKIDRKALPQPTASAMRTEYAAPRDEVERRLAAIWCELLDRPQVGVHDDFFASGGHSLLVARVFAAVRDAFGVSLPVHLLFQSPTIADLAEAIRRKRADSDETRITRRGPAVRRGSLPMSNLQRAQWLHYRARPSLHGCNVGGWRVRGPLDADVMRRALHDLFERHPILTARIGSTPDSGSLDVDAEDPANVVYEDLSELPAAEREARVARALAAMSAAVDVSRPTRLSWFTLLRLSPREHLLLVKVHFMLGEGQSWVVMWDDLWRSYRVSVSGEPPSERPRLDFRDFVLWQEQISRGARFDEAVAARRERLAGAAPIPLLAEPGDDATLRASELWELGAAASRRLREVAREVGTSPAMLALGAYAAALGRWAEQDDVCVRLVWNHRIAHPELDGVYGTFLEPLLLRFRAASRETVAELAVRAREETTVAMQHPPVPLDRVLDDPTAGDHPLAAAKFAVARAVPPQPSEIAPGLTAEELELPTEEPLASKIAVTFAEMGDDVAFALSGTLASHAPRELERFVSIFRATVKDAIGVT